MHRFIFLIAMLIASSISAQSLRNETLRLLKARKFSAIDFFIDSPDGRRISWPAQRDLLPGYREAVWVGEQFIVDKKNPDIIYSYLYHMTVLTKGDEIIAYHFTERKLEPEPKGLYYATIRKFQHPQAFAKMKIDFERLWSAFERR